MLSVLCSLKLVLNGHDVQFIVITTIIHEKINDVKGAIRSRQLTRWQKKKEKKKEKYASNDRQNTVQKTNYSVTRTTTPLK